jgi:hypothetical protein
MATGQFILRYRGQGPTPAADIERIRALNGLSVLDSSGRMLLVEAPEAELQTLVDTLPDWMLSAERKVAMPDPRQKLRQDTKGKE